MKQDIYIAVLKYGVDNSLSLTQYEDIYNVAQVEGFLTQDELHKLINKIHPFSEDLQKKKRVLDRIFEDSYDHVSLSDGYAGRRLTTEGYFKYIEYIELSESRKASKDARKYSTIALGVSIFAIIISSFFAWLQLNSPVKIKSPIRIENEHSNEYKNKLYKIINELDSIKFDLRNNKVDITAPEPH